MQVLPSKEILSAVLKINCTFVDKLCGNQLGFKTDNRDFTHLINIYELAFRTREYLKTKSKHLSLNQNIDDIFKEANDIYESLSK